MYIWTKMLKPIFVFNFKYLQWSNVSTVHSIWNTSNPPTLKAIWYDRVWKQFNILLVPPVTGNSQHASFQPVLHDWCNKGRGMCYPVCGMVHIKEPLLLIDKSSLCGGSGFPFSLSEWSLTICLTPYNRR